MAKVAVCIAVFALAVFSAHCKETAEKAAKKELDLDKADADMLDAFLTNALTSFVNDKAKTKPRKEADKSMEVPSEKINSRDLCTVINCVVPYETCLANSRISKQAKGIEKLAEKLQARLCYQEMQVCSDKCDE